MPPEETYYTDYPNRPIGGGNPYWCCCHCGRSDPEINGRLEGHSDHCEYRIQKTREIALAAAAGPAADRLARVLYAALTGQAGDNIGDRGEGFAFQAAGSAPDDVGTILDGSYDLHDVAKQVIEAIRKDPGIIA